MAATYNYDAFGNLTGKTGQANNSITYAGYQWDEETKLYYLNARYYDSVIARFISEDSYTGEENDPLSLNLYTYCQNNPIIYDDPSGHMVSKNTYLNDGGSSNRNPDKKKTDNKTKENFTAAVSIAEVCAIADTPAIPVGDVIGIVAGVAFFVAMELNDLSSNNQGTTTSKTTNKVDSKKDNKTKTSTDDKKESAAANPPKQGAGSAGSPPTGKEPKKDSKGEGKSNLPNQGTVQGNVEGAPPVDAGKQGKHVPGHKNDIPGKSQWKPGETGVNETQEAWKNGTELPDGTRVWDTGKVVGQNGETGVRVHIDGKGNIHGYPVNPGQYLK